MTLECIRRHYFTETSPLSRALEPYGFFFELFGDFRGYAEHFLLPDLVSEAGAAIRFFTDFDDFQRDALPARDEAEYREYMSRVMAFIRGRNARIAQYASAKLSAPIA